MLYVAADIYGQKINLQVESVKLPTLPELFQTIQQLFSNECYALRPAGAPLQQFSIEKVQFYSDEGKESGRPVGWKDLVSSSQLTPKAQLYVFQSDPNIEESQQKISRHLSRKPSIQAITPSPAAPASRSASGAQRTAYPVSPSSGGLDPQMQRRHQASDFPTGLPSYLGGGILPTAQDTMGTEVSPIRFRSAASGVVAASSVTPRSHRPARSLTSETTALPSVTASRTGSTTSYASPIAQVGSAAKYHSSEKPLSVATKHPGEHATPAEKHRYLFLLITSRSGSREVELDTLRVFLEDHHFGMASTIALADLFARCDKDNNGKLNAAELGALFTMLPTLMDSLYFRLLDAEDYSQLTAQLQREQVQLDSILTAQSSLVSQIEQLHRESAAQTSGISRLAEASEEVRAEIADRKESIRLLDQEAERLRQEKDACHEDARRQSSVIEQTKSALVETKRKAEQAEAFSRQAQLKLNSCEDRVKELQRMLARAQEDAAEQQQVVESSSHEALHLRGQESDLSMREKELLQGLSVRRDRSQELDLHVQRRRQQAAELREALQKLEREAQDQHVQRQAEEQKLQRTHHSEKEANLQLGRMSDTIEQQENKLRTLEEKVQQFNERRMAMEQRERPLLEQELMLRSHRDALDEQEQRLKREVGSLFYGTTD